MLINPSTQDEQMAPYDDEAIVLGATASGLSTSKFSDCTLAVLRFDAGTSQGRIRVGGKASTATDGYLVEAGQTMILSRFECAQFSGIRTGGSDCKGWITYYKMRNTR